jgi:hypothetical protein
MALQEMAKTKKPIVSMISNCISVDNRNINKERCGYLTTGVLNPFEFSYKEHHGIIPALDIVPEEIFTSFGMKKAQDYFIKAVEYSIEAGAKVILLAASTKRLFGNGCKNMRQSITLSSSSSPVTNPFLKNHEHSGVQCLCNLNL